MPRKSESPTPANLSSPLSRTTNMGSPESLNIVEESGLPDEYSMALDFPMARQSSIYSLTLDEFQNTLCEPGKNFGSMNMDEFLANIWTHEESYAVSSVGDGGGQKHDGGETAAERNLLSNEQASGLHRQGSFTIPAPLCSKTVDEVWSEIHNLQYQRYTIAITNGGNPGSTGRQPTLGEMTLEDFLIKAGVVREGNALGPSSSNTVPKQQYGVYQNNSSNPPTMESNFAMVGHGKDFGFQKQHSGMPGGIGGYQGYLSQQPPPPQEGGVIADGSHYGGNGKRSGGFPGAYAGQMPNGGGMVPPASFGAPASPVSPERKGSSHMDNSGNRYGIEMGQVKVGRKRIVDGPVEKVAERKQRRMIKNRESAARSRARKQAYTIELEAELEQLKEENNRLRREQEEAAERRRRKIVEALMAKKTSSTFEMKTWMLRRTLTGPW